MTQEAKTSQPIQGNHEDVEQIETLSPQVITNNEKIETKEDTTATAEYLAQYDEQVSLSWRSWMVVLASCFAIVAQVFVVTAAGSVIAFIIRGLDRDSPDAGALAGWIIRMSIAIVQAIPSEILPLKHRALANGCAFMGGAIGGMYALLHFTIKSRMSDFE
jgi:hypothetical protein